MIVFSTKIAKGERRGKEKTKVFIIDYAEPTPVFYKDSAKGESKKAKLYMRFYQIVP